MRHEHYRASADEARALFARAPFVHLAAASPQAEPILRALHGVVLGDQLCFHASPKGEKSEAVGWQAIASVEEIVAEIPSYFVDPERACPATTYYRSAQTRGRIEPIDSPAEKAAVLSALMARFQPEGGHVPIAADHPLYENAVRGLLLFKLPLAEAVAKHKLGQNRKPGELALILERLWQRGRPGDPRAIDLVVAANRERLIGLPDFLCGPPGVRLRCQLGAEELAPAVELLVDQYWTRDLSRAELGAAQLGATAWIGAVDEASGALIGTARALSDRARIAWIYDVAVAPAFRGRGVGQALVRMLLAHPALREVKKMLLGTRDAMALYRRFGFEPVASPLSNPNATVMARGRPVAHLVPERAVV